MEWHIQCDPKEISRYVFCPGDQARAKKIAAHLDDSYLVTDSRGYAVFSGRYKDVFMTVCGTGMGGPTVAIALEELAHMGADTFVRVGSCGVFQDGQKPGDVIIASGTFRAGGTANAYLPLNYPAVPTFAVLRALVEAAEALGIPHTVGVGLAGDAFYAPREEGSGDIFKTAGVVSVEMESDTLFVVGAYRGWRTGALYASDGAPGVIKPEWGEADYRRGEQQVIQIGLEAMWQLAQKD
ncbi:nucleoside phosphorylase [Candidatus Leptofilum sp.]|uniref:nucleoside phosphorylase n=1 Tax=Candidatus Leptofilum sp. TaxID=3241576 RepID=UPI003B5B8934